MSLLDRLEKRFGRYAVPNATLWLVAAQGFVYLADAGGQLNGPGGLIERLQLVPAMVMKGEVWRLLTYPMVPPQYPPFLLLIYLSAFYYFGGAIDAVWGSFRYNAYLLLGFLFTAIASFAEPQAPAAGDYVETSVFLAYATLFPDSVIRVYILLPIRAWVFAALTWALFAYDFWFGGLSTRLIIFAAVANYFLFFGSSAWKSVKQTKRRRDFQRRVEKGQKSVQHECRVCGLTSQMAPRTPFRYCSQCAGQCCYCPDHLRDHEHVADERLEARG